MNTEQIKYIVKVAETGSISIAADALYVTQAAVSKSISNLEKDLGVELFKRSRSGTYPTEKGENIIKKAVEIMDLWQDIKEEANLQKSVVEQNLRIAGTQGLFSSILPKTLSSFKKTYPNVGIELFEKGTHDILKDVKENKIDIGLSLIRENLWYEEDIEIEILYQGKMKVIVGKNSSLATKQTLSPKQLLDSYIVVYNGYHSKAFIQDFMNKYGKLDILFSTSNTDVIRKTVAEGLAINFTYDISLKKDPYILNGDIVALPLVNHQPLEYSFGLVRSKNQQLSTAAKEFVKQLKIQASQ